MGGKGLIIKKWLRVAEGTRLPEKEIILVQPGVQCMGIGSFYNAVEFVCNILRSYCTLHSLKLTAPLKQPPH